MKRFQNQKSGVRILVAGTVVLLILAGASIYYVYGLGGNLFGWSAKTDSTGQKSSNNQDEENPDLPPTTIDENPPTDEQVDAGNDIKDGTNNSQQPTDTSLAITSAANDNGKLKIKTLINKVTASGSCSLQLTRGGDIRNYDNVDVQALPSYSTCKGFSVNVSDLPSGTWTATVIFKDGTIESAASREVNI